MRGTRGRKVLKSLASSGLPLTGRVVLPEDSAYGSARLIWNPRFAKYPLVIVYCEQVEDVVNALRWARENDVAFRVRSGGHALEGWSTVDGGLVIDMSRMNAVHVDEAAGVGTVQTGIPVGKLIPKLAAKGFTVPFGDSSSVGIGGATLGGGFGTFSRTAGLFCDNLIGLEMVVASGERGAEVIQADETQNADLFWASRGGGGGNFGIATPFTFKLHRFPPTVTVFDLTWGWDQLGAVLDTWQRLTPSADDRLGCMLETHAKAADRVRAPGLFFGPEEELRELLQPLLSVGTPKVAIRSIPYLEAVKLMTEDDPEHRHRIDRSPKKVKISGAWAYELFPSEAIDVIRAHLEHAPPESSVWYINWGGAISRLPTDATAFFHRQAKFYLEWEGGWTRAAQEKPAIVWIGRLRQALRPFVRGSYVNVPDPDIADWLHAYYGANADRLRRIKSKYDPANVFHFEQSIPPLS